MTSDCLYRRATYNMTDHYRKFFEDADADGSGFLSQAELIGALKNNGYKGDDDKLVVSNKHARTALHCAAADVNVYISPHHTDTRRRY